MKVAFHTLGCKVNQYETEAMKEQFSASGYEIGNENEFADVYIVNTCSVTSLADRKSRQYIRRMKKINPEAIIAVTGCYAQVNKEEIAEIKEVNIVAGTNEKNNIVDYVNQYIFRIRQDEFHGIDEETELHVRAYDELDKFDEAGSITSMESRTRAYVKIQEGCNRFCSYCIIPYARGPVRSRKTEAVICECKKLIETGFKEIILTGINTALCENLEEILDKLEDMPQDFRVRLSSLEPTVVNAEYVKKLFKYKKLCHHLHLSLQAGSDKVLKAMNRRYDRQEYLDIVKTLKDYDKGYGITTDIIVGFPGETEEDFADTLDIVKKVGFCRIHVFKYSKRSGTAAYNMKNQISPVIKKERSKKLITLGEDMSRKFIAESRGDIRRVLFEEYDEKTDCLVGYTDNYIKAYLKINKKDAKRYENTFAYVGLKEPFADGAFVSLK